MPVPQKMGAGDKMGRGPYEKSGMLRDSSLPPNRMVTEKHDIPFPLIEVNKDGKISKTPKSKEMIINVELWYLPYGNRDDEDNNALFRKFSKKVTLD